MKIKDANRNTTLAIEFVLTEVHLLQNLLRGSASLLHDQ